MIRQTGTFLTPGCFKNLEFEKIVESDCARQFRDNSKIKSRTKKRSDNPSPQKIQPQRENGDRYDPLGFKRHLICLPPPSHRLWPI